MRKLGRTSSDALELLLDTVCSMFGAILLIAILVALMAQTAKVESSGGQASAEMLRRKIATAESDLVETRRLTEKLATPRDNTLTGLPTERERVDEALAAARMQRDRVSAKLQDQVARQTVDFSAEWKKLTADLRTLERRQVELTNAAKTQDENTARLNRRAVEIGTQIQKEKDARVITLRFPKERARTKRSIAIILKFGKMYPITDAEGRKNDATIVWTPKDDDAERSRPVEALGWTIAGNKAAIDRLLNSVPTKEAYLSFYVYPDSFEIFRAVRDQAAAAQIDFGVELTRAGSELNWGSKGSSPPPL